MRAILIAGLLLLAAVPARAQSVEDKLRDALRHATVDLRALQDSQAQLQADRDAAVRQRDLLQQQLTQANARVAQLQAQVATPPPKAADPEELAKLRAMLDDARHQMDAMAASNAKWQAAYQQAAGLARTRDADAKQLAQALAAARKEDAINRATNEKLAALAGDILHLYRSEDFRGILLRSYEPLLGLGKVKLDNMVQDYEDRIADLRIYPAPPKP
jgi:chromosome segregation ATPase